VRIPPHLALATKNPGKIREILEICGDWPTRWLTALDPCPDVDASPDRFPDVEETGASYRDNALLKARATASALRVPAVADDSGIEVDALDGAPGPRSARFAGERATDEQNLHLLIERFASVPADRRTARYRCVAACVWPGGLELVTEGTCEGRLIDRPRGSGGFGYDPVFVPESETRTMAELTPDEKNAISHRGQAFRALRKVIEAHLDER
jgi:XTP/dITP diphosphohydrolase